MVQVSCVSESRVPEERVFDVAKGSVVSVSLLPIPEGMTNVWGITEIPRDGVMHMDLDEFDRGDHSLEHATWSSMQWNDFVRLVYDQASSLSWIEGSTREPKEHELVGVTFLASGGRSDLAQVLREVTPATLAGTVNGFRHRHMGESFRPANIQYIESANRLYYQTSKQARQLVWASDAEGDTGTLKVDFGDGSHQYLGQLMRRFGIPAEALKPISA